MLTSDDQTRGKARHRKSEFPLLGLKSPVPCTLARQTKSRWESLELYFNRVVHEMDV